MLPLLAQVVPASAAIALATPVMLVNNLGKLVVLRGALDRAFLGRTMIGAIPGAAAGALLVGVVPEAALRRAIGAFMIGYVGWEIVRRRDADPAAPAMTGRLGAAGWGALTGFASGLVGAGGPTNAAAMNQSGLTRQTFVATGAAISVAMQLVKLPVYAASGVLRARDWPLAALLCATALAAAFAGRALLARMSDRVFRRILLAALALLGATMLP